MSSSTAPLADTAQLGGYEDWRNEVDRICEESFSLALDDMPDMPTRAAFDEGSTPGEFFSKTVVPTLREVHGSFVDAVLAEGPLDLDDGATPDVG